MITVGTWNVQNLFRPGGDSGPDTPQEYATKLAGIAATVRASGVDALGLQEVGESAAFEDLVSELGDPWTGVLSLLPDVRRGIRVGFLSRLPVERVTDTAAFPPTLPPMYADDTRFTVTRTGRGLLAVRVTAPSMTTVDLVTCHLKSKLISYPGGRFTPRDEAERARFAGYALFLRTAEAITLRALADELLDGEGASRRVVVMGDFNDEPTAATTQIAYGPGGSELGTAGAFTPDKGDAWRLWSVHSLLPDGERFSRIYRSREELIDQLLVSRALLGELGEVHQVKEAALPSIGDTPGTRVAAPFSDHAMITAQLGV